MNGCAGIVRAMATAAALLWSPHLLGQTPELPPTGARVRVVARGIAPGPVVAAVAGRHTDSLILDLEGGRRRAVPVTSITRLEISRGRKSKVVTGAAMGLILGTAATGAFLAMFCSDPDTLCESDEVLRALAIIATPPTALGALIGLAVRVERWERFPVTWREGAAIGGQRLTVGVAWRW